MTSNRGLAVLIIDKLRILLNAVHLFQSPFQQLIGQHTEALPQFVFELEGLLTPLSRDLLQGGSEVKVPYLLTQEYVHYL